MKPISQKIQNYHTQTGVGNELMFMWKYGEGMHKQTAYRIKLYHNGSMLYSTGKVISDEQNNIILDFDLAEQTEYEYTITVWDENDNEETSDRAKFITGVRSWQGKWIGNGTKKPFIARKLFNLKRSDEELTELKSGAGNAKDACNNDIDNSKAVLSVCVPGQFEVRINGEKISPYTYEGSQTDFNKHVHYSTYDVSDFIQQEENEITIEVANGWYIGDDDNGKRYFYTIDKGYEAFGEELALLAQLKVGDEYIVTDTNWEVSASQTVLADIYGSEDIDKTVEFMWSYASIINSPKGELIPYNYPPVIRKYTYEPKSIDKERKIFDFGQNMSSQFYLKIKGEKGQKVKLIPAEKLSEDGDIEQTVDTYSILTLSGREDIFEQRFSVNGARWYKIEGAELSQIIEFKSHFATSSAEDCGYFKCSDDGLNKLYGIILKAIESNINHSHTDCPTIEKLGWLEPNHLMGPSVMYNKNVDNLWSKIAMDMGDSQYEDNEFDIDTGAFPHEYKAGLIPSIAPRYARFTIDWKVASGILFHGAVQLFLLLMNSIVSMEIKRF